MIGRNTSKVLKRYILRRSLYQIQARSWRDVLGHCCIKYKQQVQVRRRELEVQVGWSWWSNDNQTTFVWHVTVDRIKLSATVTTWTWTSIISPKTSISFVFDTTIFYAVQLSHVFDTVVTLRLCQHSYISNNQISLVFDTSGSASTSTEATTGHRLYLIPRFLRLPTFTCISSWFSDLPLHPGIPIFACIVVNYCPLLFFPGFKWVR